MGYQFPDLTHEQYDADWPYIKIDKRPKGVLDCY